MHGLIPANLNGTTGTFGMRKNLVEDRFAYNVVGKDKRKETGYRRTGKNINLKEREQF